MSRLAILTFFANYGIFLAFWLGNELIVEVLLFSMMIVCSIYFIRLKNQTSDIASRAIKFTKKYFFYLMPLVGLFLYQFLHIFTYLDWSWDSLWYHSPAAATWSRELHLDTIYGDSFANSYPGGIEVLQAILWHYKPNAPSQLISLFVLSTLSVAATILVKYLGLGVKSQLAFLFCSMALPTVFSQSLTTYTDTQFGFLVFISIGLTSIYLMDKSKSILFFGSVAFAGLACFIKYQGIALLLLILLVGNFVNTQNLRGGRNTLRKLSNFFLLSMLFGFCSLGWLIKNIFRFQNPIYPFDFSLGPLALAKGIGSPNEAFLNRESSLSGHSNNPLSFFESFLHLTPSFVYDARNGGFGLLWPIFFVVAIVAAVKTKGILRNLFVFSLILTMMSPANWWPRYQIHLALASIALAIFICQGRRKSFHWLIPSFTVASLLQLIIFLPFVGPYPTFRAQPTSFEEIVIPWESRDSVMQTLLISRPPTNVVYPELEVLHSEIPVKVAFWWNEPLILPLLGKSFRNEVQKIPGSKFDIKPFLQVNRPDYFVTRETLESDLLPANCRLIETQKMGIYASKVYKCVWISVSE